MHGTDFEYTPDDIAYSCYEEVEHVHTQLTGEQVKVFFNYNSDLSGEVLISVQIEHPDDPLETARAIGDIKIPGWMLVEFVGRHVNNDLVEMLEDMSGTETLSFLKGN